MAHSKSKPFIVMNHSHAPEHHHHHHHHKHDQDAHDNPNANDSFIFDQAASSEDPQFWSPNAQHVHRHQHQHHHHNKRDHAPSALSIRRHVPGSADPTIQQLPPVLQMPSTGLQQVNVAIRRHPVEIDQNAVQPVFYPVPVYVRTPVPPLPPTPPPADDDRPIRPMADTSVYHDDSPPKQASRTAKPIAPVKKHPPPSRSPPSRPPPSRPSPVLSHQYESETFEMPPSRSRAANYSPRRPIRTDLLPTTPFGVPVKAQRPPTRYVEVEEYADDDDYYDYPAPIPTPIPKKVVKYRSVPGMTTRERENYEMSPPVRVVYVRAPRIETITYRN